MVRWPGLKDIVVRWPGLKDMVIRWPGLQDIVVRWPGVVSHTAHTDRTAISGVKEGCNQTAGMVPHTANTEKGIDGLKFYGIGTDWSRVLWIGWH